MTPSYAGIGARATPKHIIDMIRITASLLAKDGYICKTGAALGADQAFAIGAINSGGQVHLKIPWPNYEQNWIQLMSASGLVTTREIKYHDIQAYESVKRLHPKANSLSQAVIKLHARNYLIIENTQFVICWSPEGKTTGGTGQGIKIANELGITVYNLGNQETYNIFEKRINIRTK